MKQRDKMGDQWSKQKKIILKHRITKGSKHLTNIWNINCDRRKDNTNIVLTYESTS